MALNSHQQAKGLPDAEELTTMNRAVSQDMEKQAPLEDYDVENGSLGSRRMARVEPPLPRRGGERTPDDSSAEFSIEKQLEKESDNAIKYRSCSWYKVFFHIERFLRFAANC
jgi:hypothetical protein